MVAFVFSALALIVAVAVVPLYARRRPPGTPLTWGEAMVAALYVFFVMFLAWGIMPHQWLSYADNALHWRKDKIGIPAGPLGLLFGHVNNDLISNSKNVFFPNGVPLTSGHLIITAEVIRDIVAVGLYGVTLGGMIALWSVWQNRGKEKPKELPTSAYGRPLVKRA
ncbi:MAG: hypothetical protein JWO68_2290 [Actinomycetia bacterium]|nr:hypothetical protein [Actinomycetes bacterium]